MSAKHTPGPWVADDTHYTDSVVVVDSRGFSIVEATDMPILLGYAEKLGIPHWADKPGEAYLELEPEEQAANARLIAAAPEMLEALRLLTSADPLIAKATDAELEAALEDEDKEVRDKANAFLVARAVIAKATGGTP